MLDPREKEVIREEAWEPILSSLNPALQTIGEQRSEIADNMVNIAKMGGIHSAIEETADCLREMSAAIKDAQASLAAQGFEYGISDAKMARYLKVHRHTVRKWREEYEAFAADQLVDSDEVFRNSE